MDLVAVDEVRGALAAHSGHYLERVYTQSEVEECRRSGKVDPQRLASRFAAKEAVMKLLRPKRDEGVPWKSISVRKAPSGVPTVRLDGTAASLAARRGIGEISVSLTHEGALSGAVAIAQVEEGG